MNASLDSVQIDSIALEILWQRLISIMDEVDNATVRTSFSTIVGESRDFACIMLDHAGYSICQSTFSPPDFCVSLPRAARSMLQKYPVANLCEGDVLLTNDPWLTDGHLPDYVLVTPVFWQGTVVAFMGTIAHVADVGGHRGDIEAYDVFTEGLRIPPCKLYDAGKPNELLFEIIADNCRVPEMVLGDVRAIVGTHQVGARRLHDFLDDTELSDLVALAREIHDRSETAMRAHIEELPDGVYEYGLDIDGYLDIIHLHAAVTVRGPDIYVDYAGTSPQTRTAAINCVYNTTFASTMYPFKCALVPLVPNNGGLFRPIHVTAPEGCILNTTYPHPVKARAKVTNNITQVLFGAIAPIIGEHAQAGSGSIWPFSFSGQIDGYGTFSVYMLPHGGRGAMRGMDGMVPVAFPHNSTVTATEIMETQAPILILCKELLPDSAGAGRQRGGIGQRIAFRNIGAESMNVRIRPDKMFCAPPGLEGGAPGKVGQVRMNDEPITRFPPLTFNPVGYITAQAAQEDYGLRL
ncbi:hydantoinase B/oxoprolinase family protein [Chloroflexi bacterium TSY]|nr:hydantoinase B/oxoprolinase family protein [Chloroflexi bacterium TSY]